MEDNNIDLYFLFNTAQGKQSYVDPTLMNDAYLYFVPDKGKSFMLNFHPVPYDATAQGDYSHRAGNFLNHILVGDYSDFYPFELFRDKSVWNAKERGEAYYYENNPVDLPMRSDFDKPEGQISLNELAEFVSDGRKQALTAAISFLISQYDLLPENRKFLVIHDETSDKIEMWIAAIEHAFSPRMAATIPFATRMDKFSTANRYTVNQLGVFQTQINLQDLNQKQRYRAMIVGVDERDRVNASAVRSLVNSPFVLLDGKNKCATFEADTSNPYFSMITRFDDQHIKFCCEFLQMINVTTPNSDIFKLFSLFNNYREVMDAKSFPNSETAEKILSLLSKYGVFDCSSLRYLYEQIKNDIPRFLQENLYSALQIIKLMQTFSSVLGDFDGKKKLTEIVCKAFSDQVYKKSNEEGTISFWKNIKNSEFANSAVGYLVSPQTMKNYCLYIQSFKASDAVTLVRLFLESATLLGNVATIDLKTIMNYGLQFCARDNDTNSAKKILKTLSLYRRNDILDLLLSIAKEGDDRYAEFIIKLLIEIDESIFASDSSVLTFLEKLNAEKIKHLDRAVLKCRISTLSKPHEFEQFLKLVSKIKTLDPLDLTDIFETLDQKLNITDQGSINVALTIQQEKPLKATCTVSAHLYALNVLNDKSKRVKFMKIYNELNPQGFPSEQNPDYIYKLTDALLKARLEQQELSFVIQLFSHDNEYTNELVKAILVATSPKQSEKWNVLINIAAKKQDKILEKIIIKECSRVKQDERMLSQLIDMLKTREARDYFAHIAQIVKEIIRSK
jgi:hypothetical protein